MAPVEFLSEIGGILPVEGGSERVETRMLEAELETLGHKAYIAASKLFRVDCKTPQSIAQSCGNGGGLIKLDLRERDSGFERLLSLDRPLLIDSSLKFVEVISRITCRVSSPILSVYACPDLMNSLR